MHKRGKEAETVDRLPPHALEAEQAVLGCVLLDPMTVLPIVITELESPEVFYDLRHRTIYQQMIDLFDSATPIDMVTLSQSLRAGNRLDGIGGIEYLNNLPETAPSASSIRTYLELIRDKYLRRKIIAVCTETVAEAYEEIMPTVELLDQAESRVLRLGSGQNLGAAFVQARPIVGKAMERIEKITQAGAIVGLSTGFPDFDKITSGFQNGDMIIIAARASVGKTALMLNIAEHVSLDLGLPVGIFSLEMSSEQLMMRAIASRSKVNIRHLHAGNSSDLKKIGMVAAQLEKAPIWIDDERDVTLNKARAKSRRLVGEAGVKMLMIDYIQLMSNPEMQKENRAQEITSITRGLKAMAKELNLPVVVLSQLNRDMVKDKQRAPRLSDLAQSGSLENDADLVALLHQPSADDEDESALSAKVIVDVAKARNGPKGKFDLLFFKTWTRFESVARDQAMETPAMGI